MSAIKIRDQGSEDLAGHAGVPVAFRVSHVLVPAPDVGPLAFREQGADPPWWKDYDAEPGNHPVDWVRRFEISSWRVISAWWEAERVGGTVLIQGVPGVDLLEGRDDLALIWDLRVSPPWRARGIGSALVAAAEQWATRRGCVELKVETQNINVAACRFYEANGFALWAVDPCAYPGLKEVQMLWYKRIA